MNKLETLITLEDDSVDQRLHAIEVEERKDSRKKTFYNLTGGFVIGAVVIFGSILWGIYKTKNENMERHLKLPIELRQYDADQNGFIEPNEALVLYNSYRR